ncbi:MAG: MarR family transcriptional regulator [Saprospiraceae bacterium]|uniref:MarR family winged helix-turn-helix transcriptional regulator n=1 Tax=Candidatus Brachybacter algidus TaxID=2982024 RepID=UPI001B4BF169|nr:MarR family transcriptional regulator [Candidatus Brachybacter algidus]MBP7540523.1 MarR family transcriptional regulator [Saprospiraceae bacterium]MBP9126513.1 MarR family transcriptional regulator [Saprospiraceae bacterium]MBP9847129.1 MarR family transcriptional regulator [Saprospiraceae bacterium]
MGKKGLNDIIFYTLEKSIKSYRQYAQKQLIMNNFDITIDQWLILKSIKENSGLTQQQIGINVFKDYASVTRIIELLVKKNYLQRVAHTDKRRFILRMTSEAEDLMRSIQKVINANRRKALDGIDEDKLMSLKETLNKIIDNCS